MIITIANQKGGSAKTTTAGAIVADATRRGFKALAIDLDTQASLTFITGGNQQQAGSYELITKQASLTDVIQHTKQGDIIAGGINLAAADSVLQGIDRTMAVRNAIKPLVKRYDVIVIDTPPTLGTMLQNALYAADFVLIPMRAEILHLQGLYQLKMTIDHARQNNKHMKAAVLLVMFDRRTVISRDIEATIREKCKGINVPVLNSTIHEGVAVREAQTLQEGITAYSPKSKPAQDYSMLLDELGIKKGGR